MKEEVKSFLKAVSKINMKHLDAEDKTNILAEVIERAEVLLLLAFKEEIINVFDFYLVETFSKEEYRKIVRARDVVGFYCNFGYYSNVKPFLAEHYNDVDYILDVLNEYIDELESKEEEGKEDE